MEWLGQLNQAMCYIEDNLDGEIEVQKAAQLACCSSYQFQRMFSYMANLPLSEYIRRRRMTRAALDLQSGEQKVIDIALKYGYDSPTAFNRAFQSVHGVAPSVARRAGTQLKSYHPISFKITIRGEAEMNYRIEKHGAFRIVGPKLETTWSPENQQGYTDIPRFWGEHHSKGTIPQLCQIMDTQLPGVLGVSVGDWQKDSAFDYYIAVSSTQPVPAGMAEYEVPASTWAIFECNGAMPDAIQQMQQRIMTEWLPNSGYQYAQAPDIEQYSDGDQSAADYTSWIWLPIEKTE